MRVVKTYFLLLMLTLIACQADVKYASDFNSEFTESPFIHTVYFWFKEGVTYGEIKAFAEASRSLANIEGVLKVYDGTPAATDRPNLEKSYNYALVVLMKDLATHDAYQQDSTHLALLANYSAMFERVLVTDID